MKNSELIDPLKKYEAYIRNIMNEMDPCMMCKVYKEHKGYDRDHYDEQGELVRGICSQCSCFYECKFEVDV